MEKIGIFGGTFDPIHTGHLIMAQDAAEFANLDKVLIMPTATPPLRTKAPVASTAERFEMVSRATADNGLFEPCDMDLQESEISYSITVVREIAAKHPNDQLYWILGADQIAQLNKWYKIKELSQLVTFIALKRPGFEMEEAVIPEGIKVEFAPTHSFDISASEIRQRLESGQDVKYFLPPEVFEFINTRYLYTLKTESI